MTRVVAARDDMKIDAKPAISILLPVFNGARYLGEQVASILSQTYRDFELLIYDDASTDNSRDVMAELAAADARVKLFGGTTNLGQKHALDSLLRKSTADLLMFSDQDDVWHPGKIAALSAGLGDCALGYGVSKLIDARRQRSRQDDIRFRRSTAGGTRQHRFHVPQRRVGTRGAGSTGGGRSRIVSVRRRL